MIFINGSIQAPGKHHEYVLDGVDGVIFNYLLSKNDTVHVVEGEHELVFDLKERVPGNYLAFRIPWRGVEHKLDVGMRDDTAAEAKAAS